jgi:hypothetical protein
LSISSNHPKDPASPVLRLVPLTRVQEALAGPPSSLSFFSSPRLLLTSQRPPKHQRRLIFSRGVPAPVCSCAAVRPHATPPRMRPSPSFFSAGAPLLELLLRWCAPPRAAPTLVRPSPSCSSVGALLLQAAPPAAGPSPSCSSSGVPPSNFFLNRGRTADYGRLQAAVCRGPPRGRYPLQISYTAGRGCQRCYHRWTVMLHSVVPDAFVGGQRCYMGAIRGALSVARVGVVGVRLHDATITMLQ